MTSAKTRKTVAAEEVWLKRSSNTLGLGVPLVIMAIGESGEHQWWGEYSILISGGTTAYLSQRTTLNTANVPEDILGGYSSFMKMEVEQQVQTRLSVHLFELYEKTKSDYALQKIDLVDAVKEDVIRLWLRGHLHEEIKKIKDTTQSETLRTFLTKVVQLPDVFTIK